ncbi:MAG: magnesium/cobalt transporter CorA [Ferruginibacter sp.]|nr:magnesium/cobalt transporter CorA [Ferruginibacter sp.]
MDTTRKYLDYILNPLDLLRTKKVLQVNPTIAPLREEPEEIKIIVYEFDSNSAKCVELKTVEACFAFLNTPSNSWINIDGLRKDDVEKVCNHFGIHQLNMEDILSIGQRPKMDDINGIVYCLLYMLYFNEKQSTVEAEQISIILGKNFVVSFQEDATRDVFDGLRDKLKIGGSKVRQNGADFLFYSLIDLIVDKFFIVMEKLGEKVELLEEDIMRNPSKKTLVKINMLRKEMIVLKRNIAPVREIVNGILRGDYALIEEKTEKYFKDVYDHVIQANDLSENYRDMMMNLQDLYLNTVNLKLNEVMKVMAIVTCLLAPATVIGGVFGMNFDVIPFAHHGLGFYLAVAVMFIVPVVMLIIFRKRGWF